MCHTIVHHIKWWPIFVNSQQWAAAFVKSDHYLYDSIKFAHKWNVDKSSSESTKLCRSRVRRFVWRGCVTKRWRPSSRTFILLSTYKHTDTQCADTETQIDADKDAYTNVPVWDQGAIRIAFHFQARGHNRRADWALVFLSLICVIAHILTTLIL